MKTDTAKKKEITAKGVLLDPDRKSPRAAEFEQKLSALIVGQERAVRRLSGLFQIYLAGMNNPARPIGTMLFLGPTGSGKTRVVEAASEGPNLAATLNQGAFNVGNAGGAWIGGLALSAGVSYAHLPLVGAVLALLAVTVAVVSQALERSAPVAVPAAAE